MPSFPNENEAEAMKNPFVKDGGVPVRGGNTKGI